MRGAGASGAQRSNKVIARREESAGDRGKVVGVGSQVPEVEIDLVVR